jgi:hypothetical protein
MLMVGDECGGYKVWFGGGKGRRKLCYRDTDVTFVSKLWQCKPYTHTNRGHLFELMDSTSWLVSSQILKFKI